MTNQPTDYLTDFITGRCLPNIGAEANRQAFERFLVQKKGILPENILVNEPLVFQIGEETWQSKIDLVIHADGRALMCVKCAAGSLGSYDREIVAAARLLAPHPLPLAVVTDGSNALVMDVAVGKKKGEGLDAVPDAEQLRKWLDQPQLPALSTKRREKEKLIFRSYDMMAVNRG